MQARRNGPPPALIFRTTVIAPPYLIFVGEITERLGVKTGLGILEWRPEWCSGQYRFGRDACDLGLPDLTPGEAAASGIKTMVIGGATFGGRLTPEWEEACADALRAGLDVASGMHDRLNDRPKLVRLARERGRALYDVRGLPPGFVAPVASGRRRTGKRLLTVGTDCAVGKKFTALALERDMRARGLPATFRATGQTGMLISGGGVAIDSVVADFLSGVVELLSPDAAPGHWDVIEGQGSLFHPAYAPVSLGLLHGSQPDAFVVCHEAGRETVGGYPDFALPSFEEVIDLHLQCGRRLNPAIACVGVSLNTSLVAPESREPALRAVEDRLGLPCVDPSLGGTGAIIDRLIA